MIGEEKLMAYIDGELSAEEQRAIEIMLPGDRRLQKLVADEQLLRRRLADLYDPALEETLPESLTGLLHPRGSRVVPFEKPGSRRFNWSWGNLAALAASLVIGVFLGDALHTSSDGLDGETGQAQVALAEALETQLASAQVPDAQVQIGITFIGPEGRPCRTFETSEAAGLACRTSGEWSVKLLAPREAAPGSEYQRAGSASALVMTSVQELIVGEPMNVREEREARDAGWPDRFK